MVIENYKFVYENMVIKSCIFFKLQKVENLVIENWNMNMSIWLQKIANLH